MNLPKKTVHVILGIVFLVLGAYLIYPFLFQFLKLILGIILFVVGLQLLSRR